MTDQPLSEFTAADWLKLSGMVAIVLLLSVPWLVLSVVVGEDFFVWWRRQRGLR